MKGRTIMKCLPSSQRHLAVALAVAAMAVLPGCAPSGSSGSSAPAGDVVGGGGQVDAVYRQIYTPGRGTNY